MKNLPFSPLQEPSSVANPVQEIRRDAEHFQGPPESVQFPEASEDDFEHLVDTLHAVTTKVETYYRELEMLSQITGSINSGLLLEDVLEAAYTNFKKILPYERIGISLLDEGGEILYSRWAKTDFPTTSLSPGYSAPLSGSSLEKVLLSGKPRVINDLLQHLTQFPNSKPTRLLVEDGFRSSLTCPLISNNVPIGLIFFSSVEPMAYANAHVAIFQRIAAHLSVIVDKSRLVSELIDRNDSIEKNNTELARLNELKNNFVGIAAHDLRGPIGLIRNVADILIESPEDLSPEERENFLHMISNKCNYMLELINNILDVTSIEAGKLQIKKQTIELEKLLQETVSEHSKLAARKSISLSLDEPPQIAVSADPTRLRQVLDNLISNAVKYSPSESLVCVSVASNNGTVKIAVSDQGPGLTPEDQEHLFEDFKKLSAKPTGGEESTGLGLAIAKRIILAHKGKIGAESVPGQGTTFWFTLPK